MSEDQGAKVPGGEEGEGAGYVDVGGGFHVRGESAPGGSRLLHVLDRGAYLGSLVVGLGGCRFSGEFRIDFSD